MNCKDSTKHAGSQILANGGSSTLKQQINDWVDNSIMMLGKFSTKPYFKKLLKTKRNSDRTVQEMTASIVKNMSDIMTQRNASSLSNYDMFLQVTRAIMKETTDEHPFPGMKGSFFKNLGVGDSQSCHEQPDMQTRLFAYIHNTSRSKNRNNKELQINQPTTLGFEFTNYDKKNGSNGLYTADEGSSTSYPTMSFDLDSDDCLRIAGLIETGNKSITLGNGLTVEINGNKMKFGNKTGWIVSDEVTNIPGSSHFFRLASDFLKQRDNLWKDVQKTVSEVEEDYGKTFFNK